MSFIMSSGSSLVLGTVCFIEWLLTSCVVGVVVASFSGLIDRKYLYDAVSSVVYPEHRPMEGVESSEKESLQLALNMEIFVFVSVSISLFILLFLALRRKSAELFRIWVAVQIVITIMISFPLMYQCASFTHCSSLLPEEHGTIIMLSWVVWISYRFISVLIVIDELKYIAP